MRTRLANSSTLQAPGSSRDVLSPSQRSRCMSRNKGRDTGPEISLRRSCWAIGLRYRLHTKLPGRPDIVFPGAKVVVFVDGCFWHGCPEHYVAPKTRQEFWRAKRESNRQRDRKVNDALDSAGWHVLRIWEHDLRTKDQRTRVAGEIRRLVLARRVPCF